MNGMEVSKELKCDIELNQTQLKAAICNHQNFLAKLELDPYNVELRTEVGKAESEIISTGLAQKTLLERLRDEYKAYQKSIKTNFIKHGIEERRFNLTNALNRARKQNIVVRSASATSSSEDSNEILSAQCSPESQARPLEPQDVSQAEFLHYFGLGSHEVYKEMQNKRAERKRRSTANPQFLYGNKGWDFLTHNKRKRNAFLISPISPPHTRQSVKKRQERNSPPLTGTTSTQKSEQIANKAVFSSFPSIPNLPSGLIIERVSPGSSSPDSKTCTVCKQSGNLSTCEVCTNGFHISCHNRPLTHTPRQCPKCLTKETRTIGSLNVPSGMSVSYVTPTEVSEKINEKKDLEEKKQNLTAELTQLQNRHSQLTISLRNQKSEQDQLRSSQQSTEEKIKEILTFIDRMQNPVISNEISES
nr:PHD finger protein 21A-like isoform X1 [Leptinotarsa decemlineata]